MTIVFRGSKTRKEQEAAQVIRADDFLLGQVKWFGGVNRNTGIENPYGFISIGPLELFVHRADVVSSPTAMIEGADVLLRSGIDGRGRQAAKDVHVLSSMSDEQLASLLTNMAVLPPGLVLKIVLTRKDLAPFFKLALSAVTAISASEPGSALLDRFWTVFPPSKPEGQFYDLAPDAIKRAVCRTHYAELRLALANLLQRATRLPTQAPADETYEALDERDRQLAAQWGRSNEDAIVAQMLSARAAEKVVAKLYREAGATVDDVAVTQLENVGNDWKTHDLLIDGTIAIDVKNARRPVNANQFYVEHTVPRFKIDRKGEDVRIAAVLSPYLQKTYIDHPRIAPFKVEAVVFLGETSQKYIQRLESRYTSSQLKVERGNQRTFPNWVFCYPERWYPGLRDEIDKVRDLCAAVPDHHWYHVFRAEEALAAAAAFCAMRGPIPAALAEHFSSHKLSFYRRLQNNLHAIPYVPDIFLTILSDFVGAVIVSDPEYSPEIYNYIFVLQDFDFNDRRPGVRRWPLGAIDPLQLVSGLVKALTELWEHSSRMQLREFASFRFRGLGLLEARRRNDLQWTTILAYCGGMVYEKDDGGNTVMSDAGLPKPKGKCGHSPLVLGKNMTCPKCHKLQCERCDYCSDACREERFQRLTPRSHTT